MRPSRAYQIVRDEEFQSLFTELRAELLEQFAQAPIQNTDQMVRIRMMLQSLDGLKGKLESLAFTHQSNDQPQGVISE